MEVADRLNNQNSVPVVNESYFLYAGISTFTKADKKKGGTNDFPI